MQIHRKDVVGASLAIVLTVAFWQLNINVFRPKRYAQTCQSNLKKIGLAMFQYTRDYDEIFPRRANWMDVLVRYDKSSTQFVCPTRSDLASGYAMNNRINGLNLSQISSSHVRNVVMVFDSNANRNNLLFTDGHVELAQRAKFDFLPRPRPTPYQTPTPIPTPRGAKRS